MKVEEPAIKYKFPMEPEEFLNWERESEIKHEYIRGEVISMAGATFVHNKIVANLMGNIYQLLKGKSCHIYPSGLRIAAADSKDYYYPDATIICGDAEFSDNIMDTVTNPTVIWEVLSPTTENYDLGKKFLSYMKIKSLIQYITISSMGVLVRSGIRNPDNSWKFEELTSLGEQLYIKPIQQKLPLEDIYDTVHLPSVPPIK